MKVQSRVSRQLHQATSASSSMAGMKRGMKRRQKSPAAPSSASPKSWE